MTAPEFVGDHLVVLARVGDVEDLFAAPIDGSAALRNLTNNGGQRGDLTWRKEFRTQAGRLLYEMETGAGPTRTRSVHAISRRAAGTSDPLGPLRPR